MYICTSTFYVPCIECHLHWKFRILSWLEISKLRGLENPPCITLDAERPRPGADLPKLHPFSPRGVGQMWGLETLLQRCDILFCSARLAGQGKYNIYIYIIWILKNIWYLSYYIMIYFFFVRDAVSLFTRHSYNLLQKDDECVQYAEWRCSQVVNLVQSCFVTDKVTIVLALTTHVDTRFREPR